MMLRGFMDLYRQCGSILTSCDENISRSLNKKPSLRRRVTLETIFREPFHSALVGRISENNGTEQAATNDEATSKPFRLLPFSTSSLLFSIREGVIQPYSCLHNSIGSIHSRCLRNKVSIKNVRS